MRYILLLFFLLNILIAGCGPSKRGLMEDNIAAGNLDEAESICREILDRNPEDARAYYYLGKVQAERGDTLGALGSLESSVQIEPSAEAYIELARMNLSLRRLNTAMNHLENASLINEGSAGYAGAMGEALVRKSDADSVFNRGLDFYRSDDFRRAETMFSQAVELNIENREAEYYLHMSRGLGLFHRKGVDAYWDAILEFGEASVIKPERGEPHYLMGVCYEKKDSDDFDNPIKEYRKALSLELTPAYREKASGKLKKIESRKAKLDAFWGRDK